MTYIEIDSVVVVVVVVVVALNLAAAAVDQNHYYYPIEILDSCTIRGNGESIIYLELSFLSECVEKLLNTMMNGGNIPHHQNDDDNNNTDVQSDNHYDQTSTSSTTTSTTTSTLMDDEDNDDGKTSSLMNDGFINTHVSDFSLYLTCQSINQSINFAVSFFFKKKDNQSRWIQFSSCIIIK